MLVNGPQIPNRLGEFNLRAGLCSSIYKMQKLADKGSSVDERIWIVPVAARSVSYSVHVLPIGV